MLVAVKQSDTQNFIQQIRRLLVEYRLSSYMFLETHERIGRKKREHEAEEAVFQINLSLGCAIFYPKEWCIILSYCMQGFLKQSDSQKWGSSNKESSYVLTIADMDLPLH